uniref:exodeoxyribonuclease III n=1 Tax=Stegastes partitus TaxID=144197 RepID=A0A3B5ASE4_9TELE
MKNMSGELKITSLNVNGLNNPKKRKRVLRKMKTVGGDVMFLQETHLSKEEHKKLEKLVNAQVHSSSFHSARRGVAKLIKNNISFHFEKTKMDKDGRYVLVKGRIDNAEITLLNVYNFYLLFCRWHCQMIELFSPQDGSTVLHTNTASLTAE